MLFLKRIEFENQVCITKNHRHLEACSIRKTKERLYTMIKNLNRFDRLEMAEYSKLGIQKTGKIHVYGGKKP